MTVPSLCSQDAGSYGHMYGFDVTIRSRRLVVCLRHHRVPNVGIRFSEPKLLEITNLVLGVWYLSYLYQIRECQILNFDYNSTAILNSED